MPQRRHGTPPSPFWAGRPGDGRRGAQSSESWLVRWPAGGSPRCPVPRRGSPRTSPAGRAACPRLPGRPAYLAGPHVLHAHGVPGALGLVLLVPLLLAAALLAAAEAAGEQHKARHRGHGDQRPGRHCPRGDGSALPTRQPTPSSRNPDRLCPDAPCAPATTTPMGPAGLC